ncbi:MAG: thiamine pyrophosphate-dependent enzyme [Vulcanimicrobiota bacterium]
MNSFSTGAENPWCPGCGHHTLTEALQVSLSRHFSPEKVVIVTDIGCIGMADSQFKCHTIHGLHGRSPALASAIAMTGGYGTRVVVLMGDGGASIGLSHILEAARLNIDMTLIISNNQNYGMTGGQHSAYTLPGISTATTDSDYNGKPFNIVALAATMGVMRGRIAAGHRDLRHYLEHALLYRGFSLLEILSTCTTYSGKLNRESLSSSGIEESFEAHGLTMGLSDSAPGMKPFVLTPRKKLPSLQIIEAGHRNTLTTPLRILLAGSAGQGIQSAALLFCHAAVKSGLEADVFGEYPVTVGKGFSAASITISPDMEGLYSSNAYSAALITSEEGYHHCRSRLEQNTAVVMDQPLKNIAEIPCCAFADFSGSGRHNAGFAAVAWLCNSHQFFPVEALREAVLSLPAGKKRDSLLPLVLPGDS